MKKQIIICIMLIVILAGLLFALYDEKKITKKSFDNKTNSSTAFLSIMEKVILAQHQFQSGNMNLMEKSHTVAVGGNIWL